MAFQQPRITALLAAALATISTTARVRSSSSMRAYETFRLDFGVARPHDDAVGYYTRVALFEKRREEVQKHNAQPGVSWIAGVNKFADFTESEFQALLGHRPIRRAGASSKGFASFLEMPSEELAESVDWSQKLNVTTAAKDQGACGSCWAVSSAGALEAHAEIIGSPVKVSYEQLVDCTPNPEECGGTGGCSGATSELAFNYTSQHGLARADDYKGYQTGGDGTCRPPANPVLTATGFTQLEVNKLQPLLHALSTKGPVVVSASASGWSSYLSGVYDDCGKDAIINHAILMMGYGHDQSLKKDYFLIRNSWGNTWGEKGYIRLLRHASDTGDAGHCGTDDEPLQGVGCKGGVKELAVCGMCGILSDSAYPTGVKINTGV